MPTTMKISEQTPFWEDSYTEEEVQNKAEEVFRHVYRVYPTIPSPFYAQTEGSYG